MIIKIIPVQRWRGGPEPRSARPGLVAYIHVYVQICIYTCICLEYIYIYIYIYIHTYMYYEFNIFEHMNHMCLSFCLFCFFIRDLVCFCCLMFVTYLFSAVYVQLSTISLFKSCCLLYYLIIAPRFPSLGRQRRSRAPRRRRAPCLGNNAM